MFPKLLGLYGLIALILFAIMPGCSAHSWVEEVRRIGPNGTYVGAPGYQRNHMSREDPRFNGETIVLRHLPPNGRAEGPVILETDLLANPIIEGYGYSEQFPMLVASPGEFVALIYQENGHVSIPEGQANKPKNRGTIFVYGTNEASEDDTLLGIHNQWTIDGKGGDGRGRLIATRNYDDGQCYEVNPGQISQARQSKTGNQILRCQTDIRIPKDIPVGKKYTLYWVWDWPTLTPELAEKSKNGIYPTQGDGVVIPEVYTSRVDIEIVGGEDTESADASIAGAIENDNADSSFHKYDESQSVRDRAIKDQLQNLFFVQVDGSADDDEQIAPEPEDPSSGVSSVAPSTTTDATSVTTSTRKTVTVTTTLEPTTIVVVVTETATPKEPKESKVPKGSKTVTVTMEPTTLITVVTRTALHKTAASTDVPESEATPFSAGRRIQRRGNWAFGL